MVTIPWPVKRLLADFTSKRKISARFDEAQMAQHVSDWLKPFTQARRVAVVVAAGGPPVPTLDGASEVSIVTYDAVPVRSSDAPSAWPNASFDLVIAWYALESSWNWQGLLGEAFEHLGDGGTFVSVTRAEPTLFLNQAPSNDGALRALTPQELKATVGKVFGDVEIEGFFALGDVAVPTLVPAADYYLCGPWGLPLRQLVRLVADGSVQAEPRARIVRDRQDLQNAAVLMTYALKKRPFHDTRPQDFDAVGYWRERLGAAPSIQGTGTSHMPLAWQTWMYRGKVRAYKRLFKRNGVTVRDRHVLNFGCGTGYFEDVWQRLGARQLTGVDVVPSVIASLSQKHPERRYVTADLSTNPSALAAVPPVDLATAIDVLYHVVDDEKLVASLRVLLQSVSADGYFLFTDTLQERRIATHVQFRSLRQWERLLGFLGWRIVDKEPVFAVNNRRFPSMRRAPGTIGAVQHALDLPMLRVMPWAANNWALLAKREA